jgi:hypothetical protein
MKRLIFSILSILFFSVTQLHSQTIRYVTPTGAGLANGCSWANAAPGNSLQALINVSISGDEVWVAAGTYTPTHSGFGVFNSTPTNQRTFSPKDGVKVYGGFFGNEVSTSQRNLLANSSILSGDVLGNDLVTGTDTTLVFTNYTDNCQHVVKVDFKSSTLLDGFTIYGGNSPDHGGGIDLNSSNGNVFSNLIVQYNTTFDSGAGVYTGNGSGLGNTFINCKIQNNLINTTTTTKRTGAGATVRTSRTVFTNCLFSHNGITGAGNASGAGIYSELNSKLIVDKCVFEHNLLKYSTGSNSKDGAAISSSSNYVNIKNSVFDNNGSESVDNGGAIYCNNAFSTSYSNIIKNNVFYQNKAAQGGAIRISCDSIEIINNTFFQNKAFNSSCQGAAVYFFTFASSINFLIYNNIFRENTSCGSSTGSGAQVYLSSSTNPLSGNNISNNSSSVYFITTSTLNPLFTNTLSPKGADGKWFTDDDGFRVACNSPAINGATTASFTPGTDITGTSRTMGGTPDIGAYEVNGLVTISTTVTTLYVKKGGAGTGNGTSWANAMSELGDALNTAHNSASNTVNQIWVAAGTYNPMFDHVFSACTSTINALKHFY